MLHSQIEHRRSDRRDVDLAAHFELLWGRIRRVSLTEISTSDCRIASQDQQLAVGDTVLIRTSVLSGASGTVRWCHGSEAGIEFASLLDDRQLAQLSTYGPAGAKLIVTRHQLTAAAPA